MTLKSSSSLSAPCLRRAGTDIFSKILLLYLSCLTFACIYAAAEHNSGGLKDRELARLLSHKNASVGASSAAANSTSKNRLRRQHQSYSTNEYGPTPSVPPPLPPPPPQQPDYSNPQPRPPVELPLKPVANAPAFRAPSAPAPRPIRTSNTNNTTTTTNSSNNQSNSSGNALLFGVGQFTPPSYRSTNPQFPGAPLVAPRAIYAPSNQPFGPGPPQFQALSQTPQQTLLSQQQPQFAPPPSQAETSRHPPAAAPPSRQSASSVPQASQSQQPQSAPSQSAVVANFVAPPASSQQPSAADPSPPNNSWAKTSKLGGSRRNRLSGGDTSNSKGGQGTTNSLAAAPTQQTTPSSFSRPGPSKIEPAPSSESHRYYYPPRMPLPLPTCFHNPTGYACCNPVLNDLMVETYTDLEARPKFHTCNINAIAAMLQSKAEQKFNTSFETIAAFEDFAQKIHFNGDLVCKVELGGKYMLAYGSVRDAQRSLPPEEADAGPASQPMPRSRREALETTAPAFQPFIGPILEQVELPLNHISRRHSMWI